MSYAIENLKFTIFGHGYDATRNDSGYGVKSAELNMYANSAIIDETETYLWLTNGGVSGGGVHKYRLSDMTEVEQTSIPSETPYLLHPTNVQNNIGVAFVSSTEAYVFDLTDDTVIGVATGENFPNNASFNSYDCILTDNKIYFTWLHLGNTWLDLLWIDLSDMTGHTLRTIGSVGTMGFITDSLLYSVYTREWFYQTSTAYAVDLDGNTLWSNTGINRNDNINQWAIPANGKLYMPVLIDDTWHYGEFDGTSNPTFNPVTPIRTFGSFEACPDLWDNNVEHAYRVETAYNNGRTKVCAWTTQGVLLTDFNKVEKISEENLKPLALSEHYIVCADIDPYNNKTYIYGY